MRSRGTLAACDRRASDLATERTRGVTSAEQPGAEAREHAAATAPALQRAGRARQQRVGRLVTMTTTEMRPVEAHARAARPPDDAILDELLREVILERSGDALVATLGRLHAAAARRADGDGDSDGNAGED